jgi:tRNA (guanine37-N1)-methyltransferase
VQLRDFAFDKHQKVDDTPYGGGAGMVMKPEPIYRALKSLKALKKKSPLKTKRTVLLSPRGRQFDQRIAEEWSKMKEITFVCGRYEGIDQRVVDYMVDEEVSVGPYVLAGGELGALIMIEAVSRLLPGVLGNKDSLLEETFNKSLQLTADCSKTSIEYPQYTKPEKFMKWSVPEVLLSGNHEKIREWRQSR